MVLGVLIVAETLVVAVLLVSLLADHGLSVFSVEGFTTDNLFGPGLGVSLLFAFLCFTAFEATVVFSEEARDPRRTIPRALYLVIAVRRSVLRPLDLDDRRSYRPGQGPGRPQPRTRPASSSTSPRRAPVTP